MNATGPSAGSPTGAPASVSAKPLRERLPPDRGGLHQEVVRVLMIDERLPLKVSPTWKIWL